MPTALNVDREAVRVLVVAIGVRAAAREMGLPEATVQAWSARGKWLKKAADIRKKAAALLREREEARGRVQPIATKPAEALENVMAERKQQSKLGASKYVSRIMLQAGEDGTLAEAGKIKDVADIMGKVWPEQSAHGAAVNVQINLLSGARGSIDNESQ